MIRIFRWLAAILLAIVIAVVVGAIPVPTGETRPMGSSDAVRIYVLSNGFHSDIAVPADGGGALARLEIDPLDFPVESDSVRYWALGWGSQTAYTSLLDISDLTVGIMARALAFDVSVMHVQPLGEITGGEGVYGFDLTPEQYQDLLNGIRRSFGERVKPLPGITQGFADRFYRGKGRFSPVKGCNVWTARRLREAGIGVGLWPIFAQSLEFGLGRLAVSQPSNR